MIIQTFEIIMHQLVLILYYNIFYLSKLVGIYILNKYTILYNISFVTVEKFNPRKDQFLLEIKCSLWENILHSIPNCVSLKVFYRKTTFYKLLWTWV